MIMITSIISIRVRPLCKVYLKIYLYGTRIYIAYNKDNTQNTHSIQQEQHTKHTRLNNPVCQSSYRSNLPLPPPATPLIGCVPTVQHTSPQCFQGPHHTGSQTAAHADQLPQASLSSYGVLAEHPRQTGWHTANRADREPRAPTPGAAGICRVECSSGRDRQWLGVPTSPGRVGAASSTL